MVPPDAPHPSLRGAHRLAVQPQPDDGHRFFGDGAANHGTFHESLNMAAVWRLPIVYVCENNNYAMYTPSQQVTSVADIAIRAAGYDLPGLVIDGMDLLAVREAARTAI